MSLSGVSSSIFLAPECRRHLFAPHLGPLVASPRLQANLRLQENQLFHRFFLSSANMSIVLSTSLGKSVMKTTNSGGPSMFP